MENWKQMSGYKKYLISDLGNIKSIKADKMMRQRHNNYGYCIITLQTDDKRKVVEKVHRLVAKTFLENPMNYDTVDHIDFNKDNNKVSNLRWFPRSLNCGRYPEWKNQNGGRTPKELRK